MEANVAQFFKRKQNQHHFVMSWISEDNIIKNPQLSCMLDGHEQQCIANQLSDINAIVWYQIVSKL